MAPAFSLRHSWPLSVSPPFHGTPSPVSIIAKMRFGCDGAIANATLPTGFTGSPFPLSRIHVAPPSVDLNSPLPGPPLVRPHVWISICHNPAYSVRGLDGSIARSLQPVFSSTNSTRVHVPPPSMVRNTPRSCCGPYAVPSAHTSTTSGLVGWITTLAIRPVFSRPISVHVAPASVLLKMP